MVFPCPGSKACRAPSPAAIKADVSKNQKPSFGADNNWVKRLRGVAIAFGRRTRFASAGFSGLAMVVGADGDVCVTGRCCCIGAVGSSSLYGLGRKTGWLEFIALFRDGIRWIRLNIRNEIGLKVLGRAVQQVGRIVGELSTAIGRKRSPPVLLRARRERQSPSSHYGQENCHRESPLAAGRPMRPVAWRRTQSPSSWWAVHRLRAGR